jgi:outer membrane murein-binding lipoprotein Lpp
MAETPTEEQLRRLKNTVMGAGHRLSLLAKSGTLSDATAGELASISRELNAAVGRLERLLATLRRDR